MGLSKLYDEGPLRLMMWLHHRFGWWAALLPLAIVIVVLALGAGWVLGDASR
jgi:hypothetical protein